MPNKSSALKIDRRKYFFILVLIEMVKVNEKPKGLFKTNEPIVQSIGPWRN